VGVPPLSLNTATLWAALTLTTAPARHSDNLQCCTAFACSKWCFSLPRVDLFRVCGYENLDRYVLDVLQGMEIVALLSGFRWLVFVERGGDLPLVLEPPSLLACARREFKALISRDLINRFLVCPSTCLY
jgi:hypothetical protein